MTAPSVPTPNRAKTATEGHFGKSRSRLRTNSVIMLRAHALWPRGTAGEVAAITGYSTRAVEDWDAQRARIPGDALVALLQSEWGRQFLAAVMADSEPRWWLKLKALFNALDVVAMQRATRRKLKEALDADQLLAPSAAALFQDEEFYSPHLEAARERDRALVDKRRSR